MDVVEDAFVDGPWEAICGMEHAEPCGDMPQLTSRGTVTAGVGGSK